MRSRHRNWRYGALNIRVAGCLAALALVSACRGRDPYVVGVAMGTEGIRAARIAEAEINAAGGIDGHPLELSIAANAFNSSAQEALAAAERFARDPRVMAVVGHANSSASLAASQVYNSRQIVQLAPTSTAPLYGNAGPFSFRMVGGDEQQAAFIARQVLADSARGRVAVVYVNDDYGRGLHAALRARLAAGGVEPVYDGPYAEDEKFGPDHELVRALSHAGAETVVWLGRPTQFAALSPALHAQLPRVRVLASDGFGGWQIGRDGQHRFDGVRYVRLVDLDRGGRSMTALRRAYAASGDGELTDQAALTYDAVKVLAAALAAVGPHRVAIRDWLATLGSRHDAIAGVTGRISFERRQRVTPYVLERIRPAASRATGDAP